MENELSKDEQIKRQAKQITFLQRAIYSLMIAFFCCSGLMIMHDVKRNNDLTNLENDIAYAQLSAMKLSDSLEVCNARLSDIYKLSWDNIDYWIAAFDIKNPEIVKAQIYEETGNLTSNICTINHNLFGMKLASVRETTASGERSGFAYYNNYIESIQDYALWQHYFYTDTAESYYSFLVRVGYCHPDGFAYIGKLMYIQENDLTDY